MTSKERLLAALDGKCPDRLPATTHHIMGYFLRKYMDGCQYLDFFNKMELDPIFWLNAYEYTPEQLENWNIEKKVINDPQYHTVRYFIHTPVKTLTLVVQSNDYTSWQVEPLLKDKNDIEVISRYMPVPTVNRDAVKEAVKAHPDCLIRGTMACLSPQGQPGCWQELAMMFGIEDLIMETFDDPEWVHEALQMIQRKKLECIESMNDCPFDLIELGGGDASTTVISPAIFEEFVAPYDTALIQNMKKKGQRVVYHTCGGMMPILEQLADMGPNALETFTPADMGGDADLAKAKKRIGNRVCMIGGFDQGHYFTGCTEEDTRRYVRKCFADAGEGGGFILSPSDHFFDADPKLIRAFAEEAAKCRYE